jgi:hypothetical protein
MNGYPSEIFTSTQDCGLLEKRVQEGHIQHHLNAPSAGCRHDVIVPWHGRQVQAYREYEVRCAGTPVDDALRDEPRLALSSEELKMPVLHVRQVAKCLGRHAARCRWRHKRTKDLHDSAVWVLGCSVSSPEWLGMNVHKVGADGSIFILIGHHRVESDRTGPTESPRVLQTRASSTEGTQTLSSIVYICLKWTPCISCYRALTSPLGKHHGFLPWHSCSLTLIRKVRDRSGSLINGYQ